MDARVFVDNDVDNPFVVPSLSPANPSTDAFEGRDFASSDLEQRAGAPWSPHGGIISSNFGAIAATEATDGNERRSRRRSAQSLMGDRFIAQATPIGRALFHLPLEDPLLLSPPSPQPLMMQLPTAAAPSGHPLTPLTSPLSLTMREAAGSLARDLSDPCLTPAPSARRLHHLRLAGITPTPTPDASKHRCHRHDSSSGGGKRLRLLSPEALAQQESLVYSQRLRVAAGLTSTLSLYGDAGGVAIDQMPPRVLQFTMLNTPLVDMHDSRSAQHQRLNGDRDRALTAPAAITETQRLQGNVQKPPMLSGTNVDDLNRPVRAESPEFTTADGNDHDIQCIDNDDARQSQELQQQEAASPTAMKAPYQHHRRSFQEPSPGSSTSLRRARQLEDLCRIMATPTKQRPYPAFGKSPLFGGNWNLGTSYENICHMSPLRTRSLLSRTGSRSALSSRQLRRLPTDPDRILDAPGARDDYYTNLLDWSTLDTLVVGLDDFCYLWDPHTGRAEEIYQADTSSDYISACTFSPDGNRIAVGTELGDMLIFDTRVLPGATGRNSGDDDSTGSPTRTDVELCKLKSEKGVAALRWIDANSFLVGDRVGTLRLWDVRASATNPHQPAVTMNNVHLDRVVSIAVHPAYSYRVATGGNGRLINLWDMRHPRQPVQVLDHFRSAVRALQWCPWQHHILAAGGGLDDGRLCILDTESGKCETTVETGHQVCQVVWSRHFRELVSTHSLDCNQIVVWQYPSMRQIGAMPGHTRRPLHAALSPDGRTLATMAGDETVKLWNCFPTQPSQRPLRPPPNELDMMPDFGTIR